jgi:hypothetical protein
MPSNQIWTRWFHASFPGNPCRKAGQLDASPQRGVKETSRSNSDTKLEDAASPQWGTGCAKILEILCDASSLALVALGGSDPLAGFTLES